MTRHGWVSRLLWALVFVAVSVIVLARVSRVQLNLRDMDAYWQAAIRLRDGLPLYDSGGRLDGESIYRYAPWFAYAWVPLTFLPKATVGLAWTGLLAISSGLAVLPAITTRTPFGIAFGTLAAAFLVWQTSYGNVHPLMVAALVHRINRSSGPLWIALAASLKAVPILYVGVYVVRGEWTKLAATVGLTAILVLPMFAFDLSDYPFAPGNRPSLLYLGWAAYGAAVASTCLAAAWVVRRSDRFAWWAASGTVVAAVPRLLIYDITFLLVGLRDALVGHAATNRHEQMPS